MSIIPLQCLSRSNFFLYFILEMSCLTPTMALLRSPLAAVASCT